jgi:hypothetical protein
MGSLRLNPALVFCLAFLYHAGYTQTVVSEIRDTGSDFLLSVPPNTGITYRFSTSADQSGCKYKWKSKNAANHLDNQETTTQYPDFPFRWQNKNGNAEIAVKMADCTDPASNDVSATYSVPIRYLGNIGQINLNGSTQSPQTISCGKQPITFSVGTATNATNYNWNFGGLSGWTINSGQGSNTVTVTPSASSGGTIQVTATRNDAPDVSSSTEFTINRNIPQGVTSILGDDLFCNGTSYTVGSSPAGQITWATSGNISIVGGQGSGNLQVAKNGDGAGSIQLTDYDASCETTSSAIKFVWAGVAGYPDSRVNGQQYQHNNPTWVSNGTTYLDLFSNDQGYADYWNLDYGPNSSIYPNGSSCTMSFNDSYAVVSAHRTNACGGASYNFVFILVGDSNYSGYRIAGNPTTDEINIAIDTELILGDFLSGVSLFNEKGKLVRSLEKQLLEKQKKDKKKGLNIDVKNLPRGTYYLHVTVGKNVKKHAIILQ